MFLEFLSIEGICIVAAVGLLAMGGDCDTIELGYSVNGFRSVYGWMGGE